MTRALHAALPVVAVVATFLSGPAYGRPIGARTPAEPANQPQAPAALPADKESVKAWFDRYYGTRVETVEATNYPADNIALADELVRTAPSAAQSPLLMSYIAEQAFMLSSIDAEGYATSARAANLVVQAEPARRLEMLDRLLPVYDQKYRNSDGEDRDQVRETWLKALLMLGDEQAKAENYKDADMHYRRAIGIARSSNSSLVNMANMRSQSLKQRQKAMLTIKMWEGKLTSNPNDLNARRSLTNLYLIDLDNPVKAAEHAQVAGDLRAQKYVPFAANPALVQASDTWVELGDWYQGLARDAVPPSEPAMLARAKMYYQHFINTSQSGHPARTKAQAGLEKVTDRINDIYGIKKDEPVAPKEGEDRRFAEKGEGGEDAERRERVEIAKRRQLDRKREFLERRARERAAEEAEKRELDGRRREGEGKRNKFGDQKGEKIERNPFKR